MRINEHIEKYLDYYCDFGKDLSFAVLLKGKWGCGKTYFIKKYVAGRKGKNILHISLYGIDSFNGIKEKIIIELLPFIPKEYNKFASSVFKIGKKIPKIKDWIPSDTDELLVDIFLKKNKDCVFIFDDLERCNIGIDKLLGYINNFVEFKNRKVILIANEEEILKSENADKYRKHKEKLIGKEFGINSSLEEAVSLFVNGVRDSELLKYSENINKLLSKIFIQSKYDNLRLIQQALSHFEYFFSSFTSKAKDDVELFERMFYEFVVIFIEYKSGNIKSDDFFGKYPHFFKGSDTNNHFLDKYDYGISSWLTCFDVIILGKILQGIDLSEKEMNDLVSNFEKLADVDKESWQKLWNCYEQSDEYFFENLTDVQEKWLKKEYLDLSVFMHVFGMFLEFSETGLLQKSKDEIFNEGMEYINFLFKENKIPLELRDQNRGFSWRESSYGLGYYGMKIAEWNKLIEFIDKKLEDLKDLYIKERIAGELMPILKGEKSPNQSLDLLMNYNFLHTDGNKEAYFQYLDVNEITKILVKGDRVFLRALQKTFKDRYENMKTQIKDIEKELPFLEKLKDNLEYEIKTIEKKFGDKKTPRSFLLQAFINESIRPFIDIKK